jgi:uncharacterized protein
MKNMKPSAKNETQPEAQVDLVPLAEMNKVHQAEAYINRWLAEGHSVKEVARLVVNNHPILAMLLAKSSHDNVGWAIIDEASKLMSNDDMDDSFPSWDGGPPQEPTKKTGPKELVDQSSGNSVRLDPFDSTLLGHGIPNFALDPKFAPEFPPLPSGAELDAINRSAENLKAKKEHTRSVFYEGKGKEDGFDPNADWIQTHTGRRFNPLKPNPDAIVIQDIAHALSMQCRFSGHSKEFYSVAQHCVLVSYICDHNDALWGLMHDATEAYLVDVPRPLKRSGKFQAYIEFEAVMQEAICRRFALPFKEPPSVKEADTVLLATEARDLMSPLHSDWQQPRDPLPFKIEPWDHNKAKDMFMKRFFELTCPADSAKMHYEHYLKYRDVL